jgi:SAM-dependent methyltransferase
MGQITRGKTAPNRLRKTDTFLAVAYPEFVRHLPGLYVDLGYGAFPITSVETLIRLRRLNARLRVLGVEIDPQRVADAQPFAQTGLEFRLGGFNLPLKDGERAAVVRAFNVLRQYSETDVETALAALEKALAPNGLLIEGTCNPDGRLMVFNLFTLTPGPSPTERGELQRTTLVFAPSLHKDFLPRQLQPVLPKNFIHHAEPGGLIDEFFAAWHKSWQAARAQGRDTRQVFYHAALRLAETYGYSVDKRPALLKRGFLCLGPEWPEKR